MNVIWDSKADEISQGDNRREIYPFKEYKDDLDYTHYVFSKIIFHNPRYIIPKDNFTLFYNFLNGGSREYPSDGSIPVDIVGEEARIVLRRIKTIAEDPTHKFHGAAKKLLNSDENRLVRGTMKLYLGEYTSRDWRRKRSTDDIDFWILDNSLFEYVLLETGWIKNKQTKEWEKKVTWIDVWIGVMKSKILVASNDIIQSMDFGAGSYLEGPNLRNIIKKKLIRGHDVDLSDIINVAILNNIPENSDTDSPWASIEEAINMRHTRITSNIISLCRYSHGIADYLKRVGQSIQMFKELVKHQSYIPNYDIMKICRVSSHWLKADVKDGVDATRERIYKNLVVQGERKIQNSNNLRDFANRVLHLLNSKHERENIIFEISEYSNRRREG
ncbi:MAG TPA: hypothetical protein VMV49_12360 [Candidatus Deferrimicrobium sp.]|nr:hypothetical protein [Candidatus Deferrimicrobium sp.]